MKWKVWIESGCIVCRACEEICPDVFVVDEESARVRKDADLDAGGDLAEEIEEAASSCPVDVIRVEGA